MKYSLIAALVLVSIMGCEDQNSPKQYLFDLREAESIRDAHKKDTVLTEYEYRCYWDVPGSNGSAGNRIKLNHYPLPAEVKVFVWQQDRHGFQTSERKVKYSDLIAGDVKVIPPDPVPDPSIPHCPADDLYYYHFTTDKYKQAEHFYDSMIHKYPCSYWCLDKTDFPGDQNDGYFILHEPEDLNAQDFPGHPDPVLSKTIIVREFRPKH